MGKIYKLFADDHFYIGSTVRRLCTRLAAHKHDAKNSQSKAYVHFNNVGWGNVTIVMIEDCGNINKSDLRRKEQEYIQKEIQNPFCLNSRFAYTTHKEKNAKSNIRAKRAYQKHREARLEQKHEYYEEHKTEKKAYNTSYYERNKEKLKEKERERYAAKKLLAKNTETNES
jgi:hypothetical protein